MKLYCDNIDEFIAGDLFHYSVTDRDYEAGQTVTLYNDDKEHEFIIAYVHRFEEQHVLHLRSVESVNRELTGTFYAGTNPLD